MTQAPTNTAQLDGPTDAEVNEAAAIVADMDANPGSGVTITSIEDLFGLLEGADAEPTAGSLALAAGQDFGVNSLASEGGIVIEETTTVVMFGAGDGDCEDAPTMTEQLYALQVPAALAAAAGSTASIGTIFEEVQLLRGIRDEEPMMEPEAVVFEMAVRAFSEKTQSQALTEQFLGIDPNAEVTLDDFAAHSELAQEVQYLRGHMSEADIDAAYASLEEQDPEVEAQPYEILNPGRAARLIRNVEAALAALYPAVAEGRISTGYLENAEAEVEALIKEFGPEAAMTPGSDDDVIRFVPAITVLEI